MKKMVFSLLMLLPLALTGNAAMASGAEKECGSIRCDAFEPELEDKAALQRGAKYFANYCMGCHALSYMRYKRMADDLDIPDEVMQQNLNFAGGNIGGLMTIAADPKKQKKWFGAAPPDLTLVARARGPEWVYTYLRNFYADDKRPYGVNNRVFKDVAMPHALLELQGLAQCAPGPAEDEHGRTLMDPLTSQPMLFNANGEVLNACGSLKVAKAGKMDEKQFDAAVGDLVSFLAYVGEPVALKRQAMGKWALLFVFLFGIFAWALNREYWKDIH